MCMDRITTTEPLGVHEAYTRHERNNHTLPTRGATIDKRYALSYFRPSTIVFSAVNDHFFIVQPDT